MCHVRRLVRTREGFSAALRCLAVVGVSLPTHEKDLEAMTSVPTEREGSEHEVIRERSLRQQASRTRIAIMMRRPICGKGVPHATRSVAGTSVPLGGIPCCGT